MRAVKFCGSVRAMMNSAGARATHRQRRCPHDWRRASAQPSNPPTRTPGKRTWRKVPVQVKAGFGAGQLRHPAPQTGRPRKTAQRNQPQAAPSHARRLQPRRLDKHRRHTRHPHCSLEIFTSDPRRRVDRIEFWPFSSPCRSPLRSRNATTSHSGRQRHTPRRGIR